MKKKYILFVILGILLLYTCCTYSGAMKLKALFITLNPAVYVSRTKLSDYGEPYYIFENDLIAKDTGNILGVFECQRYFIFVTADYVGFP